MQRTKSAAAAIDLGGTAGVLSARRADVGRTREHRRRRRLRVLATVLAVPTAFLWFRLLSGHPFNVFALPSVDPLVLFELLIPVAIVGAVIVPPLLTGRSPHVLYRPEQIDVGLADVVGVDGVREEVVRSINLFLAHRTYSDTMGGRPRRGLLFEGPPGTGKTHLAKAMAREAGVPFLFVSSTSFQSMFYGATARKIRSYFRELRKAAQREGGAIGFIEEIDAIATARGGMTRGGMTSAGMIGTARSAATILNRNQMSTEGSGGVVNELLVQLQSFDTPTGFQKAFGSVVDRLNLLLPAHRQLSKPHPEPANVLIVAATNRADSLDPALLRPGRFDRRLTFDLPSQSGRRALLDHFLATKAHAPELDDPERRDALAAVTSGYSPAKIENLLDEGLVNAVRRADTKMTWSDVEHARLVGEVGIGAPVEYTAHERLLIATHEAGHTTVAWLVAPERRLEVLTIIKRGEALGLLAHGDRDDVFTRSRSEMLRMIQISFGGQVAEELFFGDVSTGPAGDLAYATQVGAQMIGAAGMGESLVSFAAVEDGALGGSNLVGKVLGDGSAREQLERLLVEQKTTVTELLGAHRHLVEALRDALLEHEELIGSQITDVLEAASQAVRVVDLTEAGAVVG
jgi:cell division protease FtsH